MRNFDTWLANFTNNISNYQYYTNFSKVYCNVEKIKLELNILNTLIGSKNIDVEFDSLISRYPETLKCIPILLAVRKQEIYAIDEDGEFTYNFNKINQSSAQYRIFMRKTGLFNLMEENIINNLVDYVTGVETGLDSNGRKNRGGMLMENLVESHLKKIRRLHGLEYHKEMNIASIESRWNIDLTALSNQGISDKRFDFALKTKRSVYAMETNIYTGGGSKLNETARSYKAIAETVKNVEGFEFVWFTDGKGWHSARNILEDAFNAMEHIYNIADLEAGIMETLFECE